MSIPYLDNIDIELSEIKTIPTLEQKKWLLIDLFILQVIYVTILLIMLFIGHQLLLKHKYYKGKNLTLFYIFGVLIVISRIIYFAIC